jgi:hypothetical protein
MALRNVLILRKPRSGCLEGRTALLQPTSEAMARLSLVLLAILLPARLLAAEYAEGLAPPGAPASAFPTPGRRVAGIVTDVWRDEVVSRGPAALSAAMEPTPGIGGPAPRSRSSTHASRPRCTGHPRICCAVSSLRSAIARPGSPTCRRAPTSRSSRRRAPDPARRRRPRSGPVRPHISLPSEVAAGA